ncbi:hypothetical protein [Oharaeibacter diazotrophicus]|uniref:Secreted protein n=2 Tax=Oharaeibacter diazotrophicus TaxID=1920512 RepID=A0A4R6RCD2_9HYPH|nr:hypothetical protein [Oharaeibacter diazotrophicus]TDP83347.1 hypothetical protein EDD54_3309 [Oharaeibacter diazotrophicus]BBE72180.1 hypothetical protein OHA_1_01769 [Pleomorphomonas sp. SM30]
MRPARRLVALAAVLLASAASAAAGRPPPGAIPGWFDPATGRFEPLATGSVPEDAVAAPPPPADSAYVSGSLTMNLSYTAPAGLRVEPTDTLRCSVYVAVFWKPVGASRPNASERIDYRVSINTAWKDRPRSLVVPTTMPTDEIAEPTPTVFRQFECSLYGTDSDGDSFADGTDIFIGRSNQRDTFGPKVEEDVTIFFD